jgi:hypothetical protein
LLHGAEFEAVRKRLERGGKGHEMAGKKGRVHVG